MRIIHTTILFILLLALNGCRPVPCSFEPEICYTPPASVIDSLPSPFEPFSDEERQQEWSKEMILGMAFAKEMDLYRAITCFKRALFLLPEEDPTNRYAELEYQIILCYYLGDKYQEAIEFFENSCLISATSSGFPGYRSLLIVLYDCYETIGFPDRSEKVLQLLEMHEPEAAEDLRIYTATEMGDLAALDCYRDQDRHGEQIDYFLARYEADALSPSKARTLNAMLPGAGYLYVGQRSTALTSFLLNSLFTLAAFQAFHHNQVAAGIILTGFELGWYLGGINGAGLAANQYNERLYQDHAKEYLLCEGLFPVLMFSFAF